MKVYLAAAFSRRAELRGYRDELRRAGIEVTSRWLDESEEPEPDDDDFADDVRSFAEYAEMDLEDVQDADVIVCFTEEPGGGPARGGRHVELGYALGIGLDAIVVGYRENIFHCLRDVHFDPDWEAARTRLLW